MANNKQRPTMGRTVLYTLSETDAIRINEARERSLVDGSRILHGNIARAGDTFPATVIRASDCENPPCNIQVLLDGNDVHWATSVHEAGEGEYGKPGTWSWPPRHDEPAAKQEAKPKGEPKGGTLALASQP
jgi:hypothetical protein